MRCSISEEAKHAYAHALQGANDTQNAHYSQHLPEALARMRVRLILLFCFLTYSCVH